MECQLYKFHIMKKLLEPCQILISYYYYNRANPRTSHKVCENQTSWIMDRFINCWSNLHKDTLKRWNLSSFELLPIYFAYSDHKNSDRSANSFIKWANFLGCLRRFRKPITMDNAQRFKFLVTNRGNCNIPVKVEQLARFRHIVGTVWISFSNYY